ncbi:hypothetical protein GDO78_004826 [Eleutherodactylus coqui]|uniref:Uncharacterized protein n=1 Tax=Eleutherodactylus coqui TaxID=57060 RepID=A0A8J6FIR3_ELECQ|nr:hypothetical protein GDO78_004826 [Eleutherodactylus coqui]
MLVVSKNQQGPKEQKCHMYSVRLEEVLPRTYEGVTHLHALLTTSSYHHLLCRGLTDASLGLPMASSSGSMTRGWKTQEIMSVVLLDSSAYCSILRMFGWTW